MRNIVWHVAAVLALAGALSAPAVEAGRDWTDAAHPPPPPPNAPGYPSRAADLDALPGFLDPPPGYGEVPFWWWTGDPLDKERLRWQIEELHRKGISGVQVNYAHEDTPGWPTYPAEPEIFSDAWWEMWKFAAGECGKRGMGIGLSGYTLDWPNSKSLVSRTIYSDPEIAGRELKVARRSRVQAGKTLTLELPAETVGVRAYRVAAGVIQPGGQNLEKSITDKRLEWTPTEGEWEVWVFTSVPKPGALNPMHPLAGRRVVERFFQRFQDNAPGQSAAGLNYFFHDELQFGVGDHIWTADFAEQFRARKNYDVFDALPALFADVGPRTPKARLDYMDVRMQLIQERYFVPIFQWHWSRGKIYGCDQGSRGLNPREFGDYFSAVRWYTAPGHDTPGGKADLIKGKVSSSIAHLYKRPRVWLEGYHSLGWSAAPEGLMQATCENYLYGCTLLNLHGLYYTTHGSFWEWAPPSYHFRMPYWEHMGAFLKYFERMSYLLSQGVHQCDVAVLYPVSPGQAGMGAKEATDTAFEVGARLFNTGRDFIFIDDESVARATLEDGRLHVADASYRVLVLPAMRAIRWSTLQKAQAFHRAGGIVIAVGALPEASDRAGRDDPELDAVVKDLFGATAKEIRNNSGNANLLIGSNSRPQVRQSKAGGVGAAIIEGGGDAAPMRRYPGGFSGRWAWAKEPAPNVYFKGVWQAAPGVCAVRFFCDNAGDLYVNGKAVCRGADYSSGWTGEVTLKTGDVLSVDALDHDQGRRPFTAGMFLAIARDGRTVLSTSDLRYTLAKPTAAGWRTDPNLAGLAKPDPANVHELHRGAAAGDYWTAFSEVLKAVPLDVSSTHPVKALHRKVGPRDVYLVLGAPQGSLCTFRAKGKVELWDPWTGEAKPIRAAVETLGGTRVRMPLTKAEAQLIVFSPGAPATVATAETPTNDDRADAAPEITTFALDGEWEFELAPTMDNQWGDFRLPVTRRMIGAEARIFHYAEEKTPNPAWETPELDVSQWPRVTYGFGQKFWRLGPLPAEGDAAALDARLAALKQVDPAAPVEFAGKRHRWTPYAFSWRWGKEGDPGHQGYHGLKKNVSDDFICLGKPRGGLNETLYGKEAEGARYYLWTTAVVARRAEAVVSAGGLQPAAVYLNGKRFAPGPSGLVLEAGATPLLLRYDAPGRGHFVLRKRGTELAEKRTPLAMMWYDDPGIVPYDVRPAEPAPAGWYRFTAPPGLKGMTLTAKGKVRCWIDGRAQAVKQGAATGSRVDLSEPIKHLAKVALRIEQERGFYGGSALPEPVALDCGVGAIAAGDWSQGSALECYSGGAWYRRDVSLTKDQAGSRVVLDLGDVVATAEVRVNGETAGIRVAPPWKMDLSRHVKPGANRLEILVYNTLANHYLTVPTRYRGSLRSGPIGPVRLEFQAAPPSPRIDRRALVTRNHVTLAKPDPLTPLSVGNGEFAFTADITGLQTFPEFHQQGMPLGTQSHWGWHTLPNPKGHRLADAMEDYAVGGRSVPYASGQAASGQAASGGYSSAAKWLRSNPHRLHLGRIGLRLTKANGARAGIGELAATSQTLDLWSGLLSSRFALEGQPVKVLTVCHPTRDVLAVRIESPLLERKQLAVALEFPYGSTEWRNAADWDHPASHTTHLRIAGRRADLTRALDAERYAVCVAWSEGGSLRTAAPHKFEIHGDAGRVLEIVFAFSPTEIAAAPPDFQAVRAAAAEHWRQFWRTGGAIDFSACTDPRAAELERRVVLSQYLLAIQCAGSRPPQETGLVCNSWHGKFHLEMHWWHAVHFALWDRLPLLERSLPWYQSILPAAQATAAQQGYRGARWPKMTSPGGRESPSNVGVFLIWQQPHPIYYAELCRRANGGRETLERYRELVFETAEFMASYPTWDAAGGRFVLGPALIPAQESYGRDRARNLNPTFELAYWHWGLATAQRWRERLGLERDANWDRVLRGLARPPVRAGIYTAIETPPFTITRDHPSMVAALGFVPPTPSIDRQTMGRTYDQVIRTWDWSSTWGWDYPMLAMTAARLGEPGKALDALFVESQKNRYLANGHNYQSSRLPLYLPGNGGLLAAVAMMAAGWDGCPERPTPGFPDDGKWAVRWEGLRRMP